MQRPVALILIRDPERAALAAGSSIAAYAETARLSIHTARWTLKQAMAKTRAHRQTDLVRQVIAAGAMEAPV